MSTAPAKPDRLGELLASFCDDNLSEQESRELEQLLGESAANQRRYFAYVAFHCDLAWVLAKWQHLEGSPPRPAEPRRRRSVASALSRVIEPARHPFNFGLFTMACLLLCIFGFFALVTPDWWGDTQYWVNVTSDYDEYVDRSRAAPQVARITDRSHDRQWAPGQRHLAPHAHLRMGQQVRLAAGLLEITFRDGAVVVLEGPATFAVTSRGAGTLEVGALKAEVPQQAIGFTIATPSTIVEDLGTEFGVSVDANGDSLTRVFSGQVAVHFPSQLDRHENPILLSAGEEGRFGESRFVQRVAPDDDQFAFHIPRRGVTPAGHLEFESWVVESPGLARIDLEQWPEQLSIVLPPRHDTWIDRGLAPLVYQDATLPKRCAISTEVEVVGEPTAAVMGPMVFDAVMENYVCHLGLRRERDEWIILLQSPGETHVRGAAVDGGHVELKLERNGRTYTGFVRTDESGPWRLVGVAAGIGPELGDLRAGVLSKNPRNATARVTYRNFDVTPLEASEP